MARREFYDPGDFMDFSLIEKIVLPNGLRILLLPDNRSRSACVSIWVGSGTRFEAPENNGVSHYIEHMLFKGTEKRSARDIAEQTDGIGGQLNAYTTKEYTCYYARALDSHIPLALDVLCDMLTCSTLSQSDMDTERGVILEEIGMYEDSPDDLLLDGMYASVWKDSMLGSNILGTRPIISAMTADQLRAHMAQQYTGSRTVCAVCGRFDRDIVVDIISSSLGRLPKGNCSYIAQKAEYNKSIKLIERDFEQIHLALCFPSVSQEDEIRNPLAIFNSICGGSSSSRLFQRIREELGLAYAVGSSSTPYLKEGLFEIDAAVSPENEGAALHEILCEMNRLVRDGVTADEVSRAKEQMKASIIMGLEGNSAAAGHMGRSELLKGRIRTEDQIIETIDAITVDDVNDAARMIVDFNKISICAVGKVSDANYYSGIVQKAII